MPKYPRDITGVKHTRLTPLSYAGSGKWLCRCDCGVEKPIATRHITNGKTRSCGCLASNDTEDSVWNRLWHEHKNNQDRGFGYLSYEEYKHWLQTHPNCVHCVTPPIEKRVKSTRKSVLAHGVDRIDSLLPYSLDNIQTSCKRCNRSKRNYSDTDFWDMCKRVALKHPTI